MPVGVSTIKGYLTLILSCVRLFRDVRHIYLQNSCCLVIVFLVTGTKLDYLV